MMTPAEALAALAARGLGLEERRGAGWVVLDRKGHRVHVPPKPTPGEAIEAAVAHLDDRKAEADRRAARSIVDEQQRGDFYHVPRQMPGEDAAGGGPALITVFDIVTAAGLPTPITGRASVREAWADFIAAGRPGPELPREERERGD